MKFCNLLRLVRMRNNLSIKDAASKGKFSQRVLRTWESGLSTPNISSVIRLEKTYELPEGCLLDVIGNIEIKRIYISHPLRNNKTGELMLAAVEQNRRKVSQICMNILRDRDDILILSPIHAFGFLPVGTEESSALEQCKALLELADELWVYGDWQNSEGCKIEIRYAEILKIPVKYF